MARFRLLRLHHHARIAGEISPAESAEVRLTTPEEIAGISAVKFNETVTILHDFKASGSYLRFQPWEQVGALILQGRTRSGSYRFSFEGAMLHLKDARGRARLSRDASRVRPYEDDRLVQLRFVLVGGPLHLRGEVLDGKTHLPY